MRILRCRAPFLLADTPVTGEDRPDTTRRELLQFPNSEFGDKSTNGSKFVLLRLLLATRVSFPQRFQVSRYASVILIIRIDPFDNFDGTINVKGDGFQVVGLRLGNYPLASIYFTQRFMVGQLSENDGRC